MSRTVRVTTPLLRMLTGSFAASAASATRPRVGLSPTSPQAAAGMRMEPPPSLACAMGTTPDATRAAEPPDDAPAEYSGFHGLRVGGRFSNSVLAFKPNSGIVDLPMTTTPVDAQLGGELGVGLRQRAGTRPPTRGGWAARRRRCCP